jgi:hypothetical protein
MFGTDYRNKTRSNKFNQMLFLHSDLPWHCRETLIEFFPKVERYFLESDRKNFINLPQLAREMCRVIGYPEEIHRFKPLKTKTRVKQVIKFMDDCVKYSATAYGFDGNLQMLRDIPLMELTCGEIDTSKCIKSDHIYSSIDATKSKRETLSKVEAETKGRCVAKDQDGKGKLLFKLCEGEKLQIKIN